MRRTARRLTPALLLLLALAVVPGCVRVRMVLTILPDGSGKLEFEYSANRRLLTETSLAAARVLDESGLGNLLGGRSMEEAIAGSAAKDPGTRPWYEQYDSFAGLVAFTRPVMEEDADGWWTVRFTGYFDDVSEVRFMEREAGEDPGAAFAFEKTKEGLTLNARIAPKLENLQILAGGGDLPWPGLREKLWPAVSPALKQVVFDVEVRMPGHVESAEGATSTEGRTARLLVTAADAEEPEDLNALGESKEMKVTGVKSDLPDEEIAAFRMELADAKKAWRVLRREAEREKRKAAKEAGK